jgi:hypothetical protein
MTNTNTPFWGNPGWVFTEIGQMINPYNYLGNSQVASGQDTNGTLTNTPSSGGENSFITIKPSLNVDTPALILVGVAAYFLLTK